VFLASSHEASASQIVVKSASQKLMLLAQLTHLIQAMVMIKAQAKVSLQLPTKVLI
jgi:hypothetical protein